MDFTALVIVFEIDAIVMGPLMGNLLTPRDMVISDEHKEKCPELTDEILIKRHIVQTAEYIRDYYPRRGCSVVRFLFEFRVIVFYLSMVFICVAFLIFALAFITVSEKD